MLSCWAARGSKAISVRSRRYRVGREVQTQLREDTLGRCRELLGDDGEQLWLAAESTVSPTERPSGGIAR